MGAEGYVHDAGVEQRQELLGAQWRWPGLEPVDAPAHVRLEVDI
jgi:hypothetical protein